MTDEVRALVEGRSFAFLATTRPDGSPDVVPIWLTTLGQRLGFFTQTHSSKAGTSSATAGWRSRSRTSRTRTGPHLRGRVVERLTDPGIWDEVIEPMAVRYTGERFPMRPETTVVYLVEIASAKVRELPFRHRGP